MGDMKYLCPFIQVNQITVFIIQFNADGKVFIDIVQNTFTVLQCLEYGAMRGPSEFSSIPYILVFPSP